jgi:hypothetical protein
MQCARAKNVFPEQLMSMKWYFLSIFIVFGAISAQSQAQLGMRLERGAGLYGTTINPAALSFNPSRWELNLFEADVFANQSYGSVLNASVSDILRNPEWLVLLEDLASDPVNTQIPVDFYRKGRAFGAVQARVAGPGFACRINQQHSIGLSASGRFLLSSYRVPNLLRYHRISRLKYGETYRVNPVKVATMGWAEIAGHYAYRNFDGNLLFSVGITPKFLMGAQAGYAQVQAAFDYTPVVSDTSNVGSGNWAMGFTNDFLYADDPATVSPRANGFGGGLDLGVSWAMPLEDADTPEDYLWRAGVSLLDLGAVRFGRNAEAHRIRFSQLTVVAGDTLQIAAEDSPQAAIQAVSNTFLGDPNASKVANNFTMGLPTMLSAQFDYRVVPMLYVQGVVTQRLPMYRHALKAPNTLAVVPRFEHRWAAVSVPVVLSDYRSLRVGLGARLGFLYFGSDDVLSWTGKRNLTGSDAYIGLKINGFRIGPQKRKKRERSWGGLRAKDRRWKDVGCFNQ